MGTARRASGRQIDRRLVLAIAAAPLVGLSAPAAAQPPDQPIRDAYLTAKTKLALMADEGVGGTAINVESSQPS